MSTITIDHPALNTPQPDYSPVHANADGSLYIADRYLNLSPAMQRYVLALTRIGATDLAQRVAGCCRTGHVSKRCPRGKYAIAHRHHCGDYFCATDSSGRYRFGKWAAKRDHATFLLPHEGLELKFRTHRPEHNTHRKKMNAVRTAAAKLLPLLTDSSVSVTAFAERIENDAIRVVFPGKGSRSYMAMKKILDGLGFDNLIAITKRGTAEELFLWAFNGFHDCAAMDADAKASLRVALIEYHTVTTTGTAYKVLPKTELEKLESCDEKCPVCKDHDLESVPLDERYVQRTEDIQDAYEHVDWSREHLSPFVVRKGELTNKSDREYGYSTRVPTVVFQSPPN